MRDQYIIKIVQNESEGIHNEYFELKLVQALDSLPKSKTRRWKVSTTKNARTKEISQIKITSVKSETRTKSKAAIYDNDSVVEEVRNHIRQMNWKRLCAELEHIAV